jgi:DNA/RNA-binding domain of Phe-tRNA-synthetase-like protein
MTSLRVTDDVFARFPEAVLGIVIAHGIDNSKEDAAVLQQLREEAARLPGRFAGTPVTEHPHIAPWREAYRAFGAKPKEHPSSIENLVRRVLKGQAVPHINTLVDAYNTVSLRWVVPVGGEDLDAIEGDVLLAIAGPDEAAVKLLGEPEPRAPYAGEVIYKDDLGAICRRWNWKEAERTKLTPGTRHAFLVIEGLPPVDGRVVEAATAELAGRVRASCGGEVTTARIDRERRAAVLG